MIEIFADTPYWVALQLPKDALHAAALSAVEAIPDGSQLVTTELVMIEFLNHVSRLGYFTRLEASRTWSRLDESLRVEVIPGSPALISRARTRYESLQDKSWSLTDCASILVMEDRSIQSALTSDHHFNQAGFRALMLFR
ncbi:MAG TPA: PIN domain-containing protein [Candidatus Kapabacteria bacterium]|nr:PIN domain-containing protein [Candidatus Kapabacteria bacterium]